MTYLLNSGEETIAEYDAYAGLARRYVYGPGIDEPLVWYEGTGTSDRRWYHADERGSAIAISNSSGNVTNVNAYDEYGIPASTNTGRFQYTGQQWLAELGMQYSRNRIYSPTLGRFMQTDPIGIAGGINLYAYVGGDPVNRTDPLGLQDPEQEENVVVTGNRRRGPSADLVAFSETPRAWAWADIRDQDMEQARGGWTPPVLLAAFEIDDSASLEPDSTRAPRPRGRIGLIREFIRQAIAKILGPTLESRIIWGWRRHAPHRITDLGITAEEVERRVLQSLRRMDIQPGEYQTGSFRASNDQWIAWRAYGLEDGRINVGTIHPIW